MGHTKIYIIKFGAHLVLVGDTQCVVGGYKKIVMVDKPGTSERTCSKR